MRIARLAVLLLPCLAFAQAPADVKPSSATPDLSGVWNVKGSPATRYLSWSFSKDEPPMTPWAEERFKLTKPSFGPRAVEDSNDPVNPTTLSAVGCFPPGMPRVDDKTLTDDITIEDPKAYTKPWGGQITFASHPAWNIMEMVCEDNVN